MEKENIIRMVRNACPGINNLSDRTWDEVAEAIVSLMYRETDMKESIIKIFKSISAQIRHDVFEQIERI